jgi:hypothetical protein
LNKNISFWILPTSTIGKKAVYQKQQKSFVDGNLPKELTPGLFLKGHMNVNAKELGSK